MNSVGYIYLALGFIFTFFIPGIFIVNNFFPKLPSRIKIALTPILSILISTYLIYFVSLLIGFSRYSILLVFLAFCPWLIYYLFDHFSLRRAGKFLITNRTQLFFGFTVFTLFFLALFPGIYTRHGGYIVMSSVNWQDTAMHTGIIESIAQGNFPPQAPYYSGTPLNYYFFTDFHSAILVNLFGRFFPRVLVYTNPAFAAIFALALFALAYEVSKSRLVSVVSALVGVLFGNTMFIKFFQDLWLIKSGKGVFGQVVGILASHGYSMEYEKIFQMSTMADYFLQNRPMMVGLPAVTLVILFILRGFKSRKLSYILLAGIMTGALIKFQYFGILIGALAFGLGLIAFSNSRKPDFLLRSVFAFCLPIVLISLPFLTSTSVNGKSVGSLIIENFSFGPWERGKSLSWHLFFILLNFNLPFLLTLVSILNYRKLKRPTVFLFLFAISLFAIPYTMRFTVYKGDMFKFFYFMVIPVSVLSSLFLATMLRNIVAKFVVMILFVFVASFSSILTLANSAFNKNVAYSLEDERAGLWIRTNTPQRSVFLAMPTVHTPITQIGGRLRVLSYINWPYSHGYNSGEDNVFERLRDIEGLYESTDSEVVKKTVRDYNAGYLFLGSEERSKFPRAEVFLDSLKFLTIVYNSGGIKIYEIKKNI